MANETFAAAEYEQISESYHDNRRLFIQIVVFLAVANVTVIGYAVTEKVYSLFFFGGLFMFILYSANIRSARMVLMVLLRGLRLEREMGVTGLMHYIAVGIRGRPNFMDTVTEGGLFGNGDQLQVAAKLLKQFGNISMRYDVPFALSRNLIWVLVIAGILQMGFGIWVSFIAWL